MFSGHILLFIIISFVIAIIEKKINNNKIIIINFSNFIIIFYNVIRNINNVFASICIYYIIKCIFKWFIAWALNIKMAVPKKKSSNVKLKYSIKKKEYLKKVINGKTLCKICNFELKYSWKKKKYE